MKNIKKRVLEIIQIGRGQDKLSLLYDKFIVLVIIVNILVLVLETFQSMQPYHKLLFNIETVTYVIFTIEYVLSIWTADIRYPELTPARARWRFMTSYDGVIELLTILPFFFLNGFIVFQTLRVVRIFHLFRINSKYDSFNAITSVLKAKKNQLASSVFIILAFILAASLCMYSIEHKVQPDVFQNAFSGIWWSVSTIFTVGYGDMYPITMLGRIIGVIITFLGVGLVAIPTGILSAGFVEEYNEMQRHATKPEMHRVSTVEVDDECGYRGYDKEDFYAEFGLVLLVLVRDGNVMIPTGKTRIEVGDTIIYGSNKEENY